MKKFEIGNVEQIHYNRKMKCYDKNQKPSNNNYVNVKNFIQPEIFNISK